MKELVKGFLLNNIFEPSTWFGVIILVRELLALNPSNVMIVMALLLIFVPDSAIRNFITNKAAPLKKAIEQW